ncbi:oxidoreductase [Cadophora sp. DSE1049]|nr:oxidoreductase [Cadophora sp. DSE1049]
MLTRSEVREHASRKSCWVIIKGSVYDLTNFLDDHPGGARAILKYAGRDATEAFEPIHPSNTLEQYLKPQQNLGLVTELEFLDTTPFRMNSPQSSPAKEPAESIAPRSGNMKLSSIVNISDFELAASQRLPLRSFSFFKAGADDEYTSQWNRDSWQAIRFRPRVLRPIENIDLSTTILGTKYSAPFFISPAGAGKLSHPAGEILMTKAAAKHGILHWVCNMASCTQQEMTDARAPGQTTFWQIYAMSDLAVTEREIKQAVIQGYKGFALTVDAIRAGKRERDIRVGIDEIEVHTIPNVDDADEEMSGGISARRGTVWSDFDWVSAIKWLRSMTDLPIAVKGIQSWEDAAQCMHYGAHPWLSNHGGRQLEGAPSALETLLEIRQNCPQVFEICEVIVDGGITRGTDIVKALALGAKGVGLGRAFLYSLVFGEAGVDKAIRILKQEVETAMALLGVTEIDQLDPSYVTMRVGGLRLMNKTHLQARL